MTKIRFETRQYETADTLRASLFDTFRTSHPRNAMETREHIEHVLLGNAPNGKAIKAIRQTGKVAR